MDSWKKKLAAAADAHGKTSPALELAGEILRGEHGNTPDILAKKLEIWCSEDFWMGGDWAHKVKASAEPIDGKNAGWVYGLTNCIRCNNLSNDYRIVDGGALCLDCEKKLPFYDSEVKK